MSSIMSTARSTRLVGSTIHGIVVLVATILLPILTAMAVGSIKLQRVRSEARPLGTTAMPVPPVHDPAKRTAVILTGATNAESSDLLAPYEVLAASGAFNVYTVAPERQSIALFPGSPELPGVDLVPHYSYAEFARMGWTPDLVVVPFIEYKDQQELAPLGKWLRLHADDQTIVLAICGGSMVLADLGFLDGRSATSHQNILRLVEQSHPQVRWIRNQRYVEDGNLITSGGISAGVDATLFAVARMAGPRIAEDVARKLNYPHRRFLDDPAWEVPTRTSWPARLNLAYGWRITDLGVVLYNGVDEIALSSIIDTYPRSLGVVTHTIAREHGMVRSRYGLTLVARHAFEEAPTLDRVIIPGGTRDRMDDVAFTTWARDRYGLGAEFLPDDAEAYAYDVTLTDMARRESRATMTVAATGLEYPVEHLRFDGSIWPIHLLVPPLLLSLLGFWLGISARKLLLAHQRVRSQPLMVGS